MPLLRTLAALLVTASLAPAADWPQWLGPDRNGTSLDKVAAWKAAPKALWRQTVGEGHSAPVVAAGQVFLHTRVPDKNEEAVTAFDIQTGKKLWQTTYARAGFESPFGAGPRATPAVSDGKLYALGVTGVLTCLDVKTGKQLWQVDCLKKFEAKNLTFGVSCSPLVVGKLVVVNVGGKGASIVAFDKDKGTVVWQSLDDPASYSSPITLGKGADSQVVCLTARQLVALKTSDGGLLWKYPLQDLLSESSTTPVQLGDLLIGSSVTFGSVCLKMTASPKPAAKELWKNQHLACYFSTPVPAGKNLFMVTGKLLPTPQVDLRCVDVQTGKTLWQKPKLGKYHASLLRTGNDKLLMLDEQGNLVLFDADPKQYRELAQAKVCGPTWAHPALSGGKLFIRDGKELICLKLD